MGDTADKAEKELGDYLSQQKQNRQDSQKGKK